MTTKRFSVLVMSGRMDAEPGTLVLSSVSSRPDTLSFEVYSTRGRTPLLFKGESWREWRLPPDHEGALGGRPCPIGHEVVRLVGGREGEHHDFVTVVADEILVGAKALRRTKPKTPISKFANDDVWVCACCGLRVMSRGSDNPGWKGVQMSPDSPVYTYYCPKPACVEALNAAIEQAKVNWGYEDTSDAPPEQDAPPDGDPEPQQPMGILTNRG